MIASIAAVSLGAAAGACLRWVLGLLLANVFTAFALGTLAANWIGAFAIGVFVGLINPANESEIIEETISCVNYNNNF